MVTSGWYRSAFLNAMVMIALFIGQMILTGYAPPACGKYQANEISHLVVVDDSSIRFGFSPWGSVYCGEVNRTTDISFRLINSNGAPFTGIRVNFTAYWFDGILTGYDTIVYVESLRIMHTDSKVVDIAEGVGTVSKTLSFSWVPRFSGSYLWNISVYVPGDRFPVSDVLYPHGWTYKSGAGGLTFYNGLWVGNYYNNCSDFSGWTSESQGGIKDVKWHVSSHPLAQGDSTLHSVGDVFWVGNESTGLAPSSGVYSLISPMFDLARFDASAYSIEFDEGLPQVYFMYKYRGKISPSGPAGEGGLFHYISIDDGETWAKLLDPLGRHVNITGETVSPIWDYTNHTSTKGGSKRYGLDISDYQGKQVRIKIEYHPSGIDETGFLIDDIILEGKERVDISTFSISGRSPDGPAVDPGSEMRFWAEISSTGKEPEVKMRAEAVRVPDYIADRTAVRIEPSSFSLDGRPVRMNFTIDVPRGAPSGPEQVIVRFIGSYTSKDMVFGFMVKDVHALSVTVEGDTGGTIVPSVNEIVYLSMKNEGNIQESVYTIFVSDDGLEWDQGNGKVYPLTSGQSIKARIGIKTVDMRSGPRVGHLVWSAEKIGLEASDVLKAIKDGKIPPEWTVHTLEYEVARTVDISLFSPVLYAVVADPPESGESTIFFKIYVMNRGNSEETVVLNSSLEEPEVNITLVHPTNLIIGPGILDTVVQLNATISYPINPGTYRLFIETMATGEKENSDNILELSIQIGSETNVNGIFIDNSTVSIAPEEPILGSESVVSFNAHAFGLPDNAPFNAVLQVAGDAVSRQEFLTSRAGHTLCQVKWVPDRSGSIDLILSIEGPTSVREPPLNLVRSMNLSVMVRFVDISIDWAEELANETAPGKLFFRIKVTNEGDVRADLINVILNVTSGNDTRSYLKNVTDLDPGSATSIAFGPITLKAGSTYTIIVETPERGRWKDNDPSDNRLFSQQIKVGEEPPGEPIWRNGLFLVITAASLAVLAVGLFITLYRRR